MDLYRVSQNNRQIFHGQIERTKLSRKVRYHFAIFAIINKILITKNCRKLVFNFSIFSNTINFTEKLQETKIIYFLLMEF